MATPVEVAETVGSSATEAFSVLGNETRLSILLALWEALDPEGTENAVPFSVLRKNVGARDSGRFNYHLDKLAGQFIRKNDDGYELRHAGLRFVQTVIAGAGIDTPSVEATELDKDCKYCGAPTEIFYEDQYLYKVCTACEGCLGAAYDLPDGTITAAPFDPTGLTNRSPEEAYHAAWSPGVTFLAACEGVCGVCSGPIEASIHICENHASDGVCSNCGRLPAIMTHFRCPVCKHLTAAPPYKLVAYHPAVVGFYYEHGIPLQYEVDDFESIRRRENLLVEHEQELISEEPVQVRVSIQHEDDELHVTFDGQMNVIDVDEGD